jgi:UDP-glucuronate 4-epimerase
MHVLVTGAAGFIGSHLCQRLGRDGHTVTGFDTFDPALSPPAKQARVAAIRATAGERFRLRSGDVRDFDAVRSAMAVPGIDAVVHLAGKAGIRPSMAQPLAYLDANVLGTLNVLEAMRSGGVRRLVFASSSSVYGNAAEVPFREDAPCDRPGSPYAATKKAGELLCHAWHAVHGLSVASLRFFTVYGPHMGPDGAIAIFTRKVARGEPVPLFGDGSTSRDYTHVDDTVAGICRALAWTDGPAPRCEVFNVGHGVPVSLAELLRHVAAAVGKPAIVQHLPLVAGEAARTWADAAKAERELGHVPQVAIGEGVARYVRWWRGAGEP